MTGELQEVKNTFCSYCGVKFTEQILWPRKCFKCYNDSYINPIPVIVPLILVENPKSSGPTVGVVIQKRNIMPKKGEWALPGGYIDYGETWQQAAAREVKEEIGLETSEKFYELRSVRTSTNSNMLIFCVYNQIISEKDLFNSFKENEEVSAIDIAYTDTTLAFPMHSEEISNYLNELNKVC